MMSIWNYKKSCAASNSQKVYFCKENAEVKRGSSFSCQYQTYYITEWRSKTNK